MNKYKKLKRQVSTDGGVTWSTGTSGIPSGWTVVDAT